MTPDVKIGQVRSLDKGPRRGGGCFSSSALPTRSTPCSATGTCGAIDSPKKKKRKHFLPTQELIFQSPGRG